MSDFTNYFNDLDDPRRGNARRHLFPEIMFIGFLATLCGGETAVDMADFAQAKEDLLREFLQLPHGPPSHDTFSRLFRALDPQAFASFFARFTADFRAGREGPGAIAIDGKTLRGSFDRAAGQSALNMVCAWAHEEQLVLGHSTAGKGGDEIVALRRLIALLDVKGQIVTADALHCQRETAALILERGGDYCLAIKANQGTLLEDLRLLADDQEVQFTDSFQSIDSEHGRIETRNIRVYSDISCLQEMHDWPGLRAVASITGSREINGVKKHTTRYFLLSKPLSAAQTARIVRGHWGIENNLHWVLDVTMNEDSHRARKDNAPVNFALLRRCALNIINANKDKGSNRLKFKRAGWNNQFLRKLIAQI